jgi:hypothetical protein
MKTVLRFVLVALSALWLLPAQAELTQVMIRAKAVDAKFIGTSVGGLRAVVEDAETGEVLAEGWIRGDTGDTNTLINNPIKRGSATTTATTAGYLAKLELNSPKLLRFKVIGPYGYRQALQEASVTSWVIPGKDILGDGIVLNMPGFIVDAWTRVLKGGKVDFYTKASLLCGCPIKKDGLWDPVNYKAKAVIMQDDTKVKEVALKFTGPVGLFSGNTSFDKPGHYKAIVYLFDKSTGNVGVDRTMFEVPEE